MNQMVRSQMTVKTECDRVDDDRVDDDRVVDSMPGGPAPARMDVQPSGV